MDLDHLKKLVDACHEHLDERHDKAYDELLLYLEAELPRALRFMRATRKGS